MDHSLEGYLNRFSTEKLKELLNLYATEDNTNTIIVNIITDILIKRKEDNSSNI